MLVLDGCVEELTRHIREVLKKSSLPAYNTPERIILAIDSCQDYNASPFALENKTADALTMLKLVISNLVRTKLSIDILRRHEFAVVVLNENSVDWVLDFTNNADKVIKAIGKITSKEGEDVFPLASLFEVILEKIQPQEITEAGGVIIPPQEVQRLILFYNRSYTLPELKTSDKITALLKSDYFFFDALMTHEPMDTDNHAEKISNLLQNIPYKKRGYFFSVERNAKTLLESAIQFVGHPLQRPPQENADYTLRVKLDHE